MKFAGDQIQGVGDVASTIFAGVPIVKHHMKILMVFILLQHSSQYLVQVVSGELLMEVLIRNPGLGPP
jgi:hypothetical protein